MKKTKIVVSMAVAALTILGTCTTAFADAGAYAIKDTKTNVIRQYDLKALTEAFLNNKVGQDADLLLKEFKEEQTKNGLHAIYDDSRKYISYEDAAKALEQVKASGKEFQINNFLKEAKAGEAPNFVYERKVSGAKLVNGLNITKEGFVLDLSKEKLEEYEDVKVVAGKVTVANGTIKGKLVVDAGKDSEVIVKNIKTDAITGLSGSLKLQAVEAKQLVIEKALSLNVDSSSKLTKLVITAPKGAEIVLSGNLGTVELNSAVKLTITEGTKVDIKVVTEEAKETTVVAETGAVVTTDKPLDSEGPGTVTQPGGTTGGTYTPAPTVDHSVLYTAINNIIAKIDSLDNKFNGNAGYATVTNNSSNSATITLPVGKTAGTIMNEIKASTNLATAISFTEYTALVNAIKTDAAVNTANIIAAFATEMSSIPGDYYNEGLSFVQNMVNLANNTGKAALVNSVDEFYIPEGITIKGYTVTNVTVGGTPVYNGTDKKITKASVKAALGNKTYEQAAATDVKTLLSGKNVIITLSDASGNTATYTLSFN